MYDDRHRSEVDVEMKKTCQTCEFFEDELLGRCHLHPPVFVMEGADETGTYLVWTWPLVMDTDWCGEHRCELVYYEGGADDDA